MPTKIESFPVNQAFEDYVKATGFDGNRARKNPYQYGQVPPQIKNSPVKAYVFNVGPHPHSRPMGGLGTKYIPPCPEGKDYIKVADIREYTIDWMDKGDYKLDYALIQYQELAQNLVSPTPGDASDLRRWGVFWTENEVPTDAEVSEARRLLTATYNELVKIADRLYEERKWNEITPIYKIAAKQLKAERPWNVTLKAQITCPACQKSCDTGTAKHDCGAVLDWKKALKFRLVSKADYAEAVADGLVTDEKPKVAPAAK